ncbi:MAG: alpha-isopropylmalate synthase regulatory domain-containing protein, partial [Cyanobacteria bacterium J06638_6]
RSQGRIHWSNPRGCFLADIAQGCLQPYRRSWAVLGALNLAVNQFIPVEDVRMVHYRCLATTADSPVSAVVLLERQMALFPGRGVHPDVVMASIEAYLDALGYLIFCDRL